MNVSYYNRMTQKFAAEVRERAPLVHCLTNLVVTNFTANVLLAIDAAPAMVTAEEETEEFARIADALLINLGTLDSYQIAAMRRAIAGACSARKPWILDPITAGLSFRMTVAREFLEQGPAVVRGNASEIIALADSGYVAVKGVESLACVQDAQDAARYLAQSYNTVVAVSGETDFISDGKQDFLIEGGHPLMTKVTGVGCALNAVIAAYSAFSDDYLAATVAAFNLFGTVGRFAAEKAQGAGSFAVFFLDELTVYGRADTKEAGVIL